MSTASISFLIKTNSFKIICLLYFFLNFFSQIDAKAFPIRQFFKSEHAIKIDTFQNKLTDSAIVYVIRKGFFQGSATKSAADCGNNILYIQKNKSYSKCYLPSGKHTISTNSIDHMGQSAVINIDSVEIDGQSQPVILKFIGRNSNDLYIYSNNDKKSLFVENYHPYKYIYKFAELYGEIRIQTYPFVETKSIDIQVDSNKTYYISYILGGKLNLLTEQEGEKLISNYKEINLKFKMDCKSLDSQNITRSTKFKFPYYNDCLLYPIEGIEIIDLNDLVYH